MLFASLASVTLIAVILHRGAEDRALAQYARRLSAAGEPTSLDELRAWLTAQCAGDPAATATWIGLTEQLQHRDVDDRIFLLFDELDSVSALTPRHVARAEALINRHAAELDLARDLMQSGRPVQTVPTAADTRVGFRTASRHVRMLIHLSHMRAVLAARRGDTDQAVAALRLIFWMSEAHAAAPLSLDWFWRNRIQCEAADRLVALLPSLRLTDEHRRRLVDDLRRAQDLGPSIRLLVTTRTQVLVDALSRATAFDADPQTRLTGAINDQIMDVNVIHHPLAAMHRLDALIHRLRADPVDPFGRGDLGASDDPAQHRFIPRYRSHAQAMRRAEAALVTTERHLVDPAPSPALTPSPRIVERSFGP